MDENLTVEELLRYVNGELSDERNLEIERIAMNDPLIAEAITELDLGRLSNATPSMEVAEMRDIFTQTHHDLAKEKTVETAPEKKIIPLSGKDSTSADEETFWARNKNWLAIAAILLFVAGPFWIWQSNQNGVQQSDQLFAAYFEPMPAESFRGDTDTDQFSIAAESYRKGEWNEAFDKWEAWHTVNPDNPLAGVANLYQAICLIQTDQPEKALEKLRLAPTTTSITSREQAVWYTGLAQLKLGELEAAKHLLEGIGNKVGHFKQAEARELVEKLEQAIEKKNN